MKLITISGLDGSGKSTQVEKIKKHLELKGKKVLYFHAIQFSLAQKIRELKGRYCLMCKISNKSNSISSESITRANKFQVRLRKIFLFIDVLRFKAFFLKRAGKKFDYLVSDRYFYDSIVNIEFLSKNKTKIFAEKFIPKPDHAIYLEAEPALIMQRKRVPEQGVEYLREKRDIYDNCVEKWELIRIDGNNEENKVFAEIESVI